MLRSFGVGKAFGYGLLKAVYAHGLCDLAFLAHKGFLFLIHPINHAVEISFGYALDTIQANAMVILVALKSQNLQIIRVGNLNDH